MYEEIHLRQEYGEEVALESWHQRFPQWRQQMGALLECHRLLAPRLLGPTFPQPGASLGEFRLLAELGRGTHSRVFLATQPSLADRSVVLKLGPARTLRRLNPRVSVGLADIVSRCLHPLAAKRYATAAALASDLRRHLADLPLQGVANRSLTERWSKWRRRRHALPLLGFFFAVLAALILALNLAGRQAHKAQTALHEGRLQLEQQHYVEALDALQHGMALIEDLPFQDGLKHQLHDAIQEPQRGQAAWELHRLSEHVCLLDSATVLPEAQARLAEAQCRAIWQQRAAIRQRLVPVRSCELGRQVEKDLLDLVILGAHLHVRLAAPEDKEMAIKKALKILDEAEGFFGRSEVVGRERQAQVRALRLSEGVENH